MSSNAKKDKGIALALEIGLGLIGILGIGWIYSEQTTTGIIILVGMIIWNITALIIITFTAGFGCLCTLPVNIIAIAASSIMLNSTIGRSPLFR